MHTHTPYSHTSTLSHVLTTRINNHSGTHTQLHTYTHSYRTQSLTAHIAIYIHITQIYHTQPSHTQLPTWLHNLTPYTQLYSHHTQSHIHNHTHTQGPALGLLMQTLINAGWAAQTPLRSYSQEHGMRGRKKHIWQEESVVFLWALKKYWHFTRQSGWWRYCTEWREQREKGRKRRYDRTLMIEKERLIIPSHRQVFLENE